MPRAARGRPSWLGEVTPVSRQRQGSQIAPPDRENYQFAMHRIELGVFDVVLVTHPQREGQRVQISDGPIRVQLDFGPYEYVAAPINSRIEGIVGKLGMK